MNKPPGQPLATLLLLAFLIVGLVSTLIIREVIDRRRGEVVSELGLRESRAAAERIYQHLYSVMRKGWSRAELDDTLARIGKVYPDFEIRLVRSPAVAAQYGEHSASQAARGDPAIVGALAGGARQYVEQAGAMRYILPLANQQECLACHANPEGSINGVIDIGIHADKLAQPLEATLRPLVNSATLLIVALFIAIYLLTRLQIVRPIAALSRHVDELTVRIDQGGSLRVAATWPREIQSLARKFNELAREVRDNHNRLTELAVRDKLTGLYNRRYFDEMLASTLNQAERYQQSLCLLMLDLDGFKAVNDRYGHAMGDTVLAEVGKSIQALTRDGDICSRIGGDEFLVIAVNSTLEGATLLAERLRNGIIQLRWPSPTNHGEEIAVGVSIGIAVYPDNAHTLGELLESADQAMYRDKHDQRG
jgi:diguanylate cyclase (GGDEF)-like protein